MTDILKRSADVVIPNTKGLHARASAAFVKKAEEFDCAIKVQRDQEIVEGTSILGLLMLAACKGTQITILCEGAGSDQALKAMVELVSEGFYEEDA